MVVGVVLILVGVLNFFVEPIKLQPLHAVIHIVAGLLGVVLSKSHKGYTMWVGIIGVLLGVIGLMTDNLLDLVDFPTWITIIHWALGVLGLAVWAMSRGKSMPSTPAAPAMPTGGQMGGQM